MKKNFTLCAAFLLFNSLSAQIKINEYSCSNLNGINDNFNQREDWIELYNAGASAVNVTGYHLSDNENNIQKWAFPSGTINAGSLMMIYCSGRDTVVGNFYHPNFKLTQSRYEKIILSDPSGNVIDSLTLEPINENYSWGRTTNGASTWNIFTTPSPNVANSGGTFTSLTPKPIFSLQAGVYSGNQSITITCSDPNTFITYTTDGNEPTLASPTYSGPINISTTTVVRARAFNNSPAILPSFAETNTYFLNTSHTVQIISVSGGNDIYDLFDGNQFDPDATIEYFDATGAFKTEATGTANEHGNDSWAYDQRGIDFIARDQMGYSDALRDKLFSIKKRKSFQRIILKPAANDNYPFQNGGAYIRDAYTHTLSQLAGLSMDERTWEPCVLYLNGAYWGVYEIREKADDSDFTSYYYDQDEYHLQYRKTWGATWNEYGGTATGTAWTAMRNFITGNNMADSANFAYVDSLFNWQSLVDYFCINSYSVCKDWLNWNTAWWRGLNPAGDKKKWRYTLWDMDATFGHYVNYTGIPDVTAQADPCNVENLNDPGGQGHTDIITALLNNPTFKQYYISRYIDLGNTYFSCDTMLWLLDSMINVIQPEMQDQINRWGGSYNTWQNNVTTLRQFISDRCVGIQAGLMSCYNLTGPFTLCVNTDPPQAGDIKINSENLPFTPWTGIYYGNIDILLKADADSGYIFDYWSWDNDSIIPANDSSAVMQITANGCITAHFKKPPENELVLPNVFSPNGDNVNDLFIASKFPDFTSSQLKIMDRWGKQVYNTSDIRDGWNGKSSNKDCSAGVYYYIINYVNQKAESVSATGFVELIR